MARLSPTMTPREFENGYFFVGELKDFAERLGVPSARRLRKDELERLDVPKGYASWVKARGRARS